MALSPSQMKENLGTVVPVDDDQPLTIKIPTTQTVRVPQPVPTGPVPQTMLGTPIGGHKIVGSGDEHRILTTPGGGRTGSQGGAYQRPPKFSVIVNEYMGACLEDHCNIGKLWQTTPRPSIIRKT